MSDRTLLAVEKRLRRAFEAFDKDGSGAISVDELKAVLLADVPGGTPMVEADVEAMVSAFDTNGDGELQYEEFALLWAPLLEDEEVPSLVDASSPADKRTISFEDSSQSAAHTEHTEHAEHNIIYHAEHAEPDGDPKPASLISASFKFVAASFKRQPTWSSSTVFAEQSGKSNGGKSFSRGGGNQSFKRAVSKLRHGRRKVVAPSIERSAMRSADALAELAKEVSAQQPSATAAASAAGAQQEDDMSKQPIELRVGSSLLQHDVAKAARRGSKAALTELVRGWDISGDGQLSLGELRVAIRNSLKVSATESEIRSLFSRFDSDQGGQLDLDELQPFLKTLLDGARKHMEHHKALEAELPQATDAGHGQAYLTTVLAAAEAMRKLEQAERALNGFVIALPMRSRLGLALCRRRQKVDAIIKQWPGASVGYADLDSVSRGFEALGVPGRIDAAELAAWYHERQEEGVRRAVCRIGGGIHLKTDLGALLKEGQSAAREEELRRAEVKAALAPATELQQRLLLMEKQVTRQSALMLAKAQDLLEKGSDEAADAKAQAPGAKRANGKSGAKPGNNPATKPRVKSHSPPKQRKQGDTNVKPSVLAAAGGAVSLPTKAGYHDEVVSV